MPKVRNNHAAVAQGLDQRAHVASSRPASSAAMANAKTTEKPTYPIYCSGGCMINRTSCRSGCKYIPCRGAGTRRSKGLELSNQKNKNTKNGRWACRERVCKYESIQLVAETLKKKK